MNGIVLPPVSQSVRKTLNNSVLSVDSHQKISFRGSVNDFPDNSNQGNNNDDFQNIFVKKVAQKTEHT